MHTTQAGSAVRYKQLTATGTVQTDPGAFYGLVAIASTSGSIALHDSDDSSGAKIYEKALAAGDVVHFGGAGILFANGLHAVITNTLTVNILTAS